jgi:hypothetical protein
MATIMHYAAYLDKRSGAEVYGTATLVNGSGYLFRAEGERRATLVSYKDVDLLLYGRCALADGQYLADELAGGPVGVCLSRRQEVA